MIHRSGVVNAKWGYSLYLQASRRGGYDYLTYRIIEITSPERFIDLRSRGSYREIETLCSGWASKKLIERAAAEWIAWEA